MKQYFKNMNEATAFAVDSIMKKKDPAVPGEMVDPAEYTTLDVVYERLANERPELKILTPRSEYKSIVQKISFRCTLCGMADEARKDRLLNNQSGVFSSPECKGCKKLERKRISHDWLWQKTYYYVSQRNGRILEYAAPQEGNKYNILSDKIIVECKNGHSWMVTHRFLHTGAWCVRCAILPDEELYIRPFPSFKKEPPQGLKFAALMVALGKYCGMSLKFPVIDKEGDKYFVVCLKCKQAEILTYEQVFNRRYLCLDRCVASNIPAMSTILVEYNVGVGDFHANMEKIDSIYERGKLAYFEWKKNPSTFPEPVKKKT